MPLTDEARFIASAPQAIGDGLFADRHSVLTIRIELMPETLLISTGEQARPRRRTIRSRHVAIRKPHATGRELVEMRRGDVLTAVKANVGVTHVIADDEDDVGFVGSGGEGAGADKCDEE